MLATAGDSSFAGNPLTWNLLFARQPEPDLEFTEEELEQTTNVRSSPSMPSPKQSGGGRPLLWVLLLVVLGVGAYAAMEPEMVMDLLGPLLGETPVSQPQPPQTARPAPPVPTASAPAGQRGAASTTPVPAPIATPQDGEPTPPSAPTIPTANNPPAVAFVAPSVINSPVPLFSEGQQVMVLPDSTAPGEKVTLMQDPAGTKPGPAIPPGTILTILDGDLQSSGWVYSVRSNYGTKGWIAEKQLRVKP